MSEVSGGKFVNGAISAAIAAAFNVSPTASTASAPQTVTVGDIVQEPMCLPDAVATLYVELAKIEFFALYNSGQMRGLWLWTTLKDDIRLNPDYANVAYVGGGVKKTKWGHEAMAETDTRPAPLRINDTVTKIYCVESARGAFQTVAHELGHHADFLDTDTKAWQTAAEANDPRAPALLLKVHNQMKPDIDTIMGMYDARRSH